MTYALPPEEMTYSVRPALWRRGQHWCLRGSRLTGDQVVFDLASVCDVALIQMHFGGIRSICLMLSDGQATAHIRFTTSRAPSVAGSTGDSEQQAYLALISEIGTRLSIAQPDLTYRMDIGRRARWLRFLLGLVVLLVGICLTGVAFLAYVDHWGSLLASLPFLVGVKLLGGVLMYRYWPTRRVEAFAIATLPYILWTMGGPRPDGIPHAPSTPTESP
ncbi:hypothetical protein DL237_15095 [Pseudooceanicola sediminis]|uniref:Uncharacterized protein n=1 Tax=Pseudooceanicola sediminis TaxID=2211117 RepID=A0A399IZM1_9RHOB|nr:hypothetical protein [Pseudooceanicola sediminis]KAA2313081.1 hypothetical protein E0K93_14725 [Puniceibacterium sp. HSS470]RII37729.1 hypothetical protein DL237_15095 [Pseudooceanicola sediminis]|tara:strand:- start:12844 stop:13497 length:654 start_codon:yes stop_codon:yes gene_type:complete